MRLDDIPFLYIAYASCDNMHPAHRTCITVTTDTTKLYLETHYNVIAPGHPWACTFFSFFTGYWTNIANLEYRDTKCIQEGRNQFLMRMCIIYTECVWGLEKKKWKNVEIFLYIWFPWILMLGFNSFMYICM